MFCFLTHSLYIFFLSKLLESSLYTSFLKFYEDISWYSSIFIYCVRHSIGLSHLETHFFGNVIEILFDFFLSICFFLSFWNAYYLDVVQSVLMFYLSNFKTFSIFHLFVFCPTSWEIFFFQLYFLTLLEFFSFAVIFLISLNFLFVLCLLFLKKLSYSCFMVMVYFPVSLRILRTAFFFFLTFF